MDYSEFVKEAIRTQTSIGEYLFGPELGEIIKKAKTTENAKNKGSSKIHPSSKNWKPPLRGNYKGKVQQPQSGVRHTMSAPSTNRKPPKNFPHNKNHRNFRNN